MASSSSSQETGSSNQKASKSVNSSASKRKRGKGDSSITVDVVLEAAAQVWDAEEERAKKKKTFEEKYESPMFVMTPAMARMYQEYADKMIADKKQRKADYLAARDAKLKSLGLENCDEYFVQKIAEVKQITGSVEQQTDEEEEKLLELIPEASKASEEKNREARGSRCC